MARHLIAKVLIPFLPLILAAVKFLCRCQPWCCHWVFVFLVAGVSFQAEGYSLYSPSYPNQPYVYNSRFFGSGFYNYSVSNPWHSRHFPNGHYFSSMPWVYRTPSWPLAGYNPNFYRSNLWCEPPWRRAWSMQSWLGNKKEKRSSRRRRSSALRAADRSESWQLTEKDSWEEAAFSGRDSADDRQTSGANQRDHRDTTGASDDLEKDNHPLKPYAGLREHAVIHKPDGSSYEPGISESHSDGNHSSSSPRSRGRSPRGVRSKSRPLDPDNYVVLDRSGLASRGRDSGSTDPGDPRVSNSWSTTSGNGRQNPRAERSNRNGPRQAGQPDPAASGSRPEAGSKVPAHSRHDADRGSVPSPAPQGSQRAEGRPSSAPGSEGGHTGRSASRDRSGKPSSGEAPGDHGSETSAGDSSRRAEISSNAPSPDDHASRDGGDSGRQRSSRTGRDRGGQSARVTVKVSPEARRQLMPPPPIAHDQGRSSTEAQGPCENCDDDQITRVARGLRDGYLSPEEAHQRFLAVLYQNCEAGGIEMKSSRENIQGAWRSKWGRSGPVFKIKDQVGVLKSHSYLNHLQCVQKMDSFLASGGTSPICAGLRNTACLDTVSRPPLYEWGGKAKIKQKKDGLVLDLHDRKSQGAPQKARHGGRTYSQFYKVGKGLDCSGQAHALDILQGRIVYPLNNNERSPARIRNHLNKQMGYLNTRAMISRFVLAEGVCKKPAVFTKNKPFIQPGDQIIWNGHVMTADKLGAKDPFGFEKLANLSTSPAKKYKLCIDRERMEKLNIHFVQSSSTFRGIGSHRLSISVLAKKQPSSFNKVARLMEEACKVQFGNKNQKQGKVRLKSKIVAVLRHQTQNPKCMLKPHEIPKMANQDCVEDCWDKL